jgi:hypothetical protein
MAKIGADKKRKRKPSTRKQYERFEETARNLGVYDKKSADSFEDSFRKIVPPSRKLP